MFEIAQNNPIFDDSDSNDYEVGDTSFDSFDGDIRLEEKHDTPSIVKEPLSPGKFSERKQKNKCRSVDWKSAPIYFDDTQISTGGKPTNILETHDSMLKRQRVVESPLIKDMYHTFGSISSLETKYIKASVPPEPNHVNTLRLLNCPPSLEKSKSDFGDISSGPETVTSSRSASASSATSEESTSPAPSSSETISYANNSIFIKDDGIIENQGQFTNETIQQPNALQNNCLPELNLLVVKKRSSNFHLSHKTSCDTLVGRKRDALTRKIIRYSPSRLDLIDNQHLTSFPLAPPNISISENDPIVFIEDYFVPEDSRQVTKSRKPREFIGYNSITYNYSTLSPHDGNCRSTSSHLRSAYLLNTASKLSPVNPNRTIFKSQSSRSTSSSMSNVTPTLRSCMGCQKPLYELSSRLARDVSFTEFVCVDCATQYPNSDGLRQAISTVILPGTKTLRRMPSSIDSLKMISLKIELLDQEDPEWWSKLRKKLRWRWRLKGLVPCELIHYLDGFRMITSGANTPEPADSDEEELEGENSVEYHDHNDFDAQFNMY
ncbi:hypothetical protein NADFUDRAFT_66512 [Nadsonia fulvescens var. elongata DSM 6958]|uniref:Uncharacterized protein n=1 Tax=Nadsonia fulvescens var. elongata DSM 6958 TaxID=857566 RepID=A0A1E3PJ33_9ASCO|nr:hypothetical protein NADFUDRAFT_66512 [Nadsonia fulvescens var. elongata DSM 6958]